MFTPVEYYIVSNDLKPFSVSNVQKIEDIKTGKSLTAFFIYLCTVLFSASLVAVVQVSSVYTTSTQPLHNLYTTSTQPLHNLSIPVDFLARSGLPDYRFSASLPSRACPPSLGIMLNLDIAVSSVIYSAAYRLEAAWLDAGSLINAFPSR